MKTYHTHPVLIEDGRKSVEYWVTCASEERAREKANNYTGEFLEILPHTLDPNSQHTKRMYTIEPDMNSKEIVEWRTRILL